MSPSVRFVSPQKKSFSKAHTDAFVVLRNSFRHCSEESRIFVVQKSTGGQLQRRYGELVFLCQELEDETGELEAAERGMSISVFAEEEDTFTRGSEGIQSRLAQLEKKIRGLQAEFPSTPKGRCVGQNIARAMGFRAVHFCTKFVTVQEGMRRRIVVEGGDSTSQLKQAEGVFSVLSAPTKSETRDKLAVIDRKLGEILQTMESIQRVVSMHGEKIATVGERVEEAEQNVFGGSIEVAKYRKRYEKKVKLSVAAVLLGLIFTLLFVVLSR
ncbi:MAG: uncharacterized protein A8A55_0369 [Amphiamblys sp. WSBS2006]|nr:MAG: uncharacterized protein A8A55_0369 [Amphiamblys sp. WSBS2006]